jgi:hypothetical protein
MQLFKTTQLNDGLLSQSAMPKASDSSIGRMADKKVRAIVLNTYFVDDAEALPRRQIEIAASNRNPQGAASTPAPSAESRHVYCDVLVYSSMHGVKKGVLRRCLVAQPPGAGLHTGELWMPRPTTQRIDGESLDTALTRINPASVDGDHVLVEFLDGDRFLPTITGSVPHPARDVGTEAKTNGTPTRLKKANGFPKLTKFNGVVHGVDANGNYIIDATRANKGIYDAKGREPRLSGDPADSADQQVPTDGTCGNIILALRPGSRLIVSCLTDPANPGSSQETSLTFEDGRVTLQARSTNPSSIVVEPGAITIDAQADAGTVNVRGATADLQTGAVRLGDGAAYHVPRGELYNSAHQTMDTALTTLLSAISAAALTLSTGVSMPPGTTAPAPFVKAFADALIAAIPAAVAAIQSFDNSGAPNALSADVVTR